MRTSLKDLKEQMFDVLERLKCSGEPGIDPRDTISLEAAGKMAEVAGVIIACAKIEVSALNIISRSDNPRMAASAMTGSGLLSLDDRQLPGGNEHHGKNAQ